MDGAMPEMPAGEMGAAEGAPAPEMASPEVPAGDTPAEGEAAAAFAIPEQPAEGGEAAVDAGAPEEGGQAPEVAPLTDEAPVIEETAAVELTDMGGNDITSVKEAMLRDLFPIMDKVEMAAEEKFDLYKRMLDDTNDKSLISGAYEVVKGIGDESARAEALLFLIKKADA